MRTIYSFIGRRMQAYKQNSIKTTSLSSFPFLILSLFLMPSCGKLPGFSVGEQSASFSQEEVIDPVVDLLFVIDNSGSMAEEQTNLSNNFSTFITEFSNKSVDFHVGIISTDEITPALASSYGYPNWWAVSGTNQWGNSFAGIYNGGPGGLLSKSQTLTFLEPSQGAAVYVPQFQANVQLGVNGNGSETPLLAIQQAIDPALTGVGQRNEGFFREQAGLAVIIVTDEDESIAGDNHVYLRNNPTDETARLDAVETALVDFKGGDRNLLSVNVITNPSAGACAASWDVGETVVKFANRFDGIVANICDDFADSLNNIGEQILSLITRFELPQPIANPETATVTVDGGVIPKDDTDGWSYIEDTGVSPTKYYIQFNGNSIPPAGSSIKIDYTPGAPV